MSKEREQRPEAVVTVGVMDGVHLGHLEVVGKVVNESRLRNARAVVFTLDPHPRSVVSGVDVPALCTLEDRIQLLVKAGVDQVETIQFDKKVSAMSPEEFITKRLMVNYDIVAMVVGYDNRMGRNRAGDQILLIELGSKYNFDLVEAVAVEVAGEPISSSRIRTMLAEGAVDEAALLLGRPFSVRSTVVQGEKRGRTIGYPTANLAIDPHITLPARGVYAVRVSSGGVRYAGMLNLGVRPTFGQSQLVMEVHIIEFDKDIYGETINIEFFERLRSERKFEGIEALRKQLSDDKRRCMASLRGVI